MVRALQARSAKTLEVILEAAEALIRRRGLKSLTLDAVAAEAQVSKGGLQHHFRSKEALVEALVSRKLSAIRAGTDAVESALGPARHPALVSLLRHSSRQYGDEDGFPVALLVAATENSECLLRVRSMVAETLERIRAESGRPEEASLLMFAALGLLITRTLGFSTLPGEQASRLFVALERLSDALDPPDGAP